MALCLRGLAQRSGAGRAGQGGEPGSGPPLKPARASDRWKRRKRWRLPRDALRSPEKDDSEGGWDGASSRTQEQCEGRDVCAHVRCGVRVCLRDSVKLNGHINRDKRVQS